MIEVIVAKYMKKRSAPGGGSCESDNEEDPSLTTDRKPEKHAICISGNA